MKITVIVPTYHAYYFNDIIASYVWQNIPTDQYEVLFMVTAESPNDLVCTIEKVSKEKGLPWKAIAMPKASNCLARNEGTRCASGDVVLFIDGDQIIAPHLFGKHIEAHSGNNDCGYVGMGICNIDVALKNDYMDIGIPHIPSQRVMLSGSTGGMPKFKVYSVECLKFVHDLTLSQAIGFAWWHNMNNLVDYVNVVGRNVSVTRKDFIGMGMWDESLDYSATTTSRGWEDLELGLRAYKAGLKFAMVPSWTVHLEHPRMNKDGGIDNIVKVARKHRWFLEERGDWWTLRYDRNHIRSLL